MFGEIRNLLKHRYLIWELIKKDFKAKYAGSIFGLFWSVIVPLLRLALFVIVFSLILKVKFDESVGIANFTLYLICGILPWFAFQQSVARSTTALVENGNVIRAIIFPSKVFPFCICVSSLIDELISLSLFVVAIALFFRPASGALPFIFIVLLMQFLFTVGFSWILSTVYVFFRDIVHIMEIVFMAWMYLTPIFYPESMVPQALKIVLVKINPLAYLVRFYRDIFLAHRIPSISEIGLFAVVSVTVFIIGYLIFEVNQRRFSDLI